MFGKTASPLPVSCVLTGKDANVARRELLLFLKSSQHYTAESVISSFPQDGGYMRSMS